MNISQGVAVGIVICLPGSGYEQVHRFPLILRSFPLCYHKGASVLQSFGCRLYTYI